MYYIAITTTGIFSCALLLWLIREIFWIGRLRAPEIPHTLLIGGPARERGESIPKIIWSYWHELPEPEFITRCFANWQRMAPDHDIRVLQDSTLPLWLEGDAPLAQLANLPAYRRADWLRLQLLQAYGGIWIDASTLLTQDLCWLHDTQNHNRCDYVGYYIQRYSTSHDQPIVENWFMAAVPSSPFIRDLTSEFALALTLGEKGYLRELEKNDLRERVVQGLGNMQEYLIMHVAAAVVLNTNQQPYRLALTRAEDSAFLFLANLGWSRTRMYIRLALSRCPSRLPAVIKFRGHDRKVLEKGLAKRWLLPSSLLAKFLYPQDGR